MKRLIRSPEFIVSVASGVWGLFWIPLRALEERGLDPSLTTLSQFFAPLLILLPIALWRWGRKRPIGLRQYKTGILIGTAVGLYLFSLLLTDVARALILFYVMPAWGTLVEVGFMGRPFTRWRALSLVLSLSGLAIILGIGTSLFFQINFGDICALISGILFTLGARLVREDADDLDIFEQLFAYFFYGTISLSILFLILNGSLGTPPALSQFPAILPLFLFVSVTLPIPVMSCLYWGSSKIDPGRLGILLQLEAVVGIASAALLAGEPFGIRQLFGAILVISAGVVEVRGSE